VARSSQTVGNTAEINKIAHIGTFSVQSNIVGFVVLRNENPHGQSATPAPMGGPLRQKWARRLKFVCSALVRIAVYCLLVQ
jgi:hypothetical protein